MSCVPAIPPEDYKGTQANWMTKLQERGLWDGVNPEWHGDVLLSTRDYFEILKECEND